MWGSRTSAAGECALAERHAWPMRIVIPAGCPPPPGAQLTPKPLFLHAFPRSDQLDHPPRSCPLIHSRTHQLAFINVPKLPRGMLCENSPARRCFVHVCKRIQLVLDCITKGIYTELTTQLRQTKKVITGR